MPEGGGEGGTALLPKANRQTRVRVRVRPRTPGRPASGWLAQSCLLHRQHRAHESPLGSGSRAPLCPSAASWLHHIIGPCLFWPLKQRTKPAAPTPRTAAILSGKAEPM